MKDFVENEFMKSVILLFTVLGIIMLFKTEKIGFLLHPRMFLPVKISVVILIFFTIYQSIRYSSGKVSRFKSGPVFFLIPLLLAVHVNIKPLGADVGVNRGLNYSGAVKVKNDFHNILEDCIILNDRNFIPLSEDIYSNINSYKGKDVKIMGFGFKMNDFKRNQFGIGRMAIFCCASDSVMVGFLCEVDKEEHILKDQWMAVEGKITSGNYNNKEMPIIKVSKIKKVNPPKDPYVY